MAAARAADALRYLGTFYPECLHALRVLDEHEEAAHRAAVRGDRDAYLEALRGYCRAGRDAALEVRRSRGEGADGLSRGVRSKASEGSRT